MCAYLAQLNATACRYSPYPCQPYPSDSEECGYSSNDEMTYYGQMFKQRAQNYWQNARPKSVPDSTESTPKVTENDNSVEGKEDSDSTDTETDIIEKTDGNNNISDGSEASDDDSSQSGTEIPHQLSIIYEETEPQSEADSKISFQPSDDDDSSITLGNDSRKTSADNTSSDTESSVVRVRLPLKLKFSPSNTECQVTTVIVGDSEMESSPDVRSEDVWSPSPERVCNSPPKNASWSVCYEDEKECSPSADVTFTISLNKKKNPSPNTEEPQIADVEKEAAPKVEKSIEDEVDFWKEIKTASCDNIPSFSNKNKEEKSLNILRETDTNKKDRFEKEEASDSDEESDSESISDEEAEVKRFDRTSSVPVTITTSTADNDNSDEDESDSDSQSDSDEKLDESASSVNPAKCGSVRRNMDLLMFKTSIDNDKSREGDESDNDDSSDSDSSCANLSLGLDGQTDDRTNERLVEESEEDDSGVTSDLSRHISETDTDAECGSELSKMTRYQRAATHSRLFKLLQDECSSQDENDNDSASASEKERLTLPLVANTSKSNISSDQESSSSGIDSPMSPAVNERLVKELVQSLLSRKKGRHFRKLPLEKLYAAAARILHEDMDYDTGSTSDDSNMFLSPCDNSRLERPPGYQLPDPEHYGENYYDYCDYYSSWANADYYSCQPTFDILPSKTFRTLRETTENEKNKLDLSYPVRCPKLSLPKVIPSEPKADTAPPET